MKKVIFATALLLTVFIANASPAFAVSLFQPFGGKITDTVSCICSLSTKIEVSGAKGGTFMKVPVYTKVYNHNKLETGSNVVGQALLSEVPCMYLVVVSVVPPVAYCEPRGYGKIIDKVGTSN